MERRDTRAASGCVIGRVTGRERLGAVAGRAAGLRRRRRIHAGASRERHADAAAVSARATFPAGPRATAGVAARARLPRDARHATLAPAAPCGASAPPAAPVAFEADPQPVPATNNASCAATNARGNRLRHGEQIPRPPPRGDARARGSGAAKHTRWPCLPVTLTPSIFCKRRAESNPLFSRPPPQDSTFAPARRKRMSRLGRRRAPQIARHRQPRDDLGDARPCARRRFRPGRVRRCRDGAP